MGVPGAAGKLCSAERGRSYSCHVSSTTPSDMQHSSVDASELLVACVQYVNTLHGSCVHALLDEEDHLPLLRQAGAYSSPGCCTQGLASLPIGCVPPSLCSTVDTPCFMPGSEGCFCRGLSPSQVERVTKNRQRPPGQTTTPIAIAGINTPNTVTQLRAQSPDHAGQDAECSHWQGCCS